MLRQSCILFVLTSRIYDENHPFLIIFNVQASGYLSARVCKVDVLQKVLHVQECLSMIVIPDTILFVAPMQSVGNFSKI